MSRFDYHIIAIDSVYDARPSATGIIPLNTAWQTEEKELERYERKLLEGVIVATPEGYSEKNYMPIDPGIPNHKIYTSHDAIQLQRNMGRTDWGNEKYHPGMKEQIDFVTIAEYGAMIDAKVGEKVYFHPAVTESENFLEGKDGKRLYLAAVDQIICVVADGGIRPQGGYVLVEPSMESKEALVSTTGLILKTEIEAKLLEGTVRHARIGADVRAGDEILYQQDANWEVMIEGVKCYAMKEEEIFMRKLTV